MARPKAIRQTLQLRIMLLDVMPHVWRQVLVPDSITLPRLNQVILHAMGWLDCHLHEFEIGQQRYGQPDPDFMFDDGLINENRVTLSKALHGIFHHFEYLYDFGDGWRHLVVVENRFVPEQPLTHATCIGGENACPPEDIGGPFGYQDLLQALKDPKHEEHDQYLEWIGDSFDPHQFDIDRTNALLQKIKT